MTPFDPATAIKQINSAYRSLLHHPVVSPEKMQTLNMQRGLDGNMHPRIISLGGDHTIVRNGKALTCCTADVDQRSFLSWMLFMKSMDQSPLFILMLMSTHGTHTDMLVVSRSRLTLTTGHSFGTRTRKVS